MEPISLLVAIIVGVVVLAIIYYILQYVGLPAPITNIILLVAALLILLWLLRGGGWSVSFAEPFSIGSVWLTLVRLL